MKQEHSSVDIFVYVFSSRIIVTLEEALSHFSDQCNNNDRLRQMNADWNRRLHIYADDRDEWLWLNSQEGTLSSGLGQNGEPDLIIRGAYAVLLEVFSGQITPTDPYNAGDLLVQGSQDDLFRLDIISLLIWGE